MSKFAHVVKTAGHLINDGLFERLVKNHRYFFGVAVAKNNTIMLNHMKQQAPLDALKKVQETFKDQPVVFAFGDVANVLDDDIQPISILKDADGNTVCIVCLDGDFERHRKSNETHSPEYTIAKGNLEKRIQRYAGKGMSIDDIIGELNDDLTKQDISNLWGERGSVTFMFSDGQVCTISSGGEQVGKYSFGFASNRYGYMENVGEKTEEKKSVVVDVLSSLLGSSPKPASEVVPQNGTVVSSAVIPPTTETAIDEPLPEGTILVKPDFRVYDTRRKQKGWYEDRLGYEPQRYRDAPPLLRIPGKNAGEYTWRMADTKHMGILKHTMVMDPAADAATKVTKEEQAQLSATTSAPKAPEPVISSSSEGTVVAPAWLQSKKSGQSKPKEVGGAQSRTIAENSLPAGTTEKVHAQVSTERVAIIPPDQIQKMQEVMKKTEFVGMFSESLKQINDPKILRSQIDTELPTFAQRFGLGENMSVFEGWKYEQFFNLAVAFLQIGKPDLIAKFMFDERNHGLRQKLFRLEHAGNNTRQAM